MAFNVNRKTSNWPAERFTAAFHVFGGILANAAGRTPLPRIAHYCPTWKCNQHCADCTVWRREPEPELDGASVVRMFAKLPFLDVVKIVGGEPFARDDLADIATGIFRHVHPYILQVVTNGSMTDRILGFAKQVGSPRMHLRVSLSGIGKTHERFSGGASYEYVYETLVKLAELRPKLGFGLGINFRVSDDTVDDLPKAMEIYGSLGIDVIPGVHYSPFLQDIDVSKVTFKPDVKNPNRLMRAMSKIPTERANMSWLERLVLGRFSDRTAKRWLLGDSDQRRFGCRELRNLMYILPAGDLVMCGLRQKPLANIAEQDFHSVWFSKEMDEHRRAVDECPGCPQAAVEIFSRLYLGPLFISKGKKKYESTGGPCSG